MEEFSLFNSSSSNLNFGISWPAFLLNVDPAQGSIAPFSRMIIQVSIKEEATHHWTGSLTVNWSNGNKHDLIVQVLPASPTVSISSSVISFPPTPIGQTSSSSLSFVNHTSTPQRWSVVPASSAVSSSPLSSPRSSNPFSIRPLMGCLGGNERGEVLISFFPLKEGKIIQKFVVMMEGDKETRQRIEFECEGEGIENEEEKALREKEERERKIRLEKEREQRENSKKERDENRLRIKEKSSPEQENERRKNDVEKDRREKQQSQALEKALQELEESQKRKEDYKKEQPPKRRPPSLMSHIPNFDNPTEKPLLNKVEKRKRPKPKGLYVKDKTLIFGPTLLNTTRKIQIRVCNNSAADLKVYVVSTDPPFSVRHNKIAIRSRAFVALPVRFSPLSEGIFQQTLTLTTHYREEGTKDFCQVKLMGEGVKSPLLVSTRNLTFSPTLSSEVVRLLNVGTFSLKWKAELSHPFLFFISAIEGKIGKDSAHELTITFLGGKDGKAISRLKSEKCYLLVICPEIPLCSFKIPLHINVNS